ncbi:prenyl cysteine carboxyl methyltransferase Ste14 [Talaromyces stipitatus ATCC 10500]|uniref:Protein-S-isoprenylcysteine O-methyltransferase n=1 Tax=Talaromyces stipitatus (strain ATCC 10500 / CBS 375.48 / QM 6759 / NRRL 1006) TaxID=441959 RepID=B8M1H7_TALSN|nr:prenyl cysteine carboxyl methyltransferase Ste14 [Talaromyces stipitatus ATCC 10500]EED21873.1 prenyl cysteine carboxyl methyltransferase Ste14 [Talaromyces stipitatus ATCC 10500]
MSIGVSSFTVHRPSEPSDIRPRSDGEHLAWRPPTSSIPSNNPSTNYTAYNPSMHIAPPNGNANPPNHSTATSSNQLDPSVILPNGEMSLSGISTRAFFIGVVLGISSTITILLLTIYQTRLWRIPFFISSLCLFHFLEYWATAQYNTQYADVSSFLLTSNGPAYNIAHGSAMLECLISHYFFAPSTSPILSTFSTISVIFGIICMVTGQIVRTLAMATAGTNFNHVVQVRRQEGHVLVTGGIYRFLRHPSYFGFFWWGLGSQLVLQNVVCFVGYAVVLWQFFNSRIYREERFLIAFFGDEYISYKSRTIIGIPFIA